MIFNNAMKNIKKIKIIENRYNINYDNMIIMI